MQSLHRISFGAATFIAVVLLPIAHCGPAIAADASPAVGSTTMQRDSASTTAPLIGSEWQLVQLGVAPAQREAQTRGRPAQLVLRAGGGYEGSSGCNRIFGTYRLQGDSLSLAPVAGTKMACPGPLMKQERNLIAALDATTGYRITGHALHLFHGRKLLARFESPSPIPGK